MSKKYAPNDIKLMKLMQDAGYSAQHIAEVFAKFYPGITRCAVLGVLFRERHNQ